MNQEQPTFIRLYTGRKYNYVTPSASTIVIEDIAISLSRLPRFCGHTPRTLTVGEHSVRASYLCPEMPLEALLHDASEAYCNDLMRPLKYLAGMDEYRRIELQAQDLVSLVFCCRSFESAPVKRVDKYLQSVEQAWKKVFLNDGVDIQPGFGWPEEIVRNTFLMRFYELTGVSEFFAPSQYLSQMETQ